MTICKLLLVFVVLAPSTLAQARPAIGQGDGRILLETASGARTPLTEGPGDYGARLAADGRTVVFCRYSQDFVSAIYSVDIETRKEQVLFAGPLRVKGTAITNLTSPELDLAKGMLYVIAGHSVTTGSLFVVDLRTGRSKYLAEAGGVDLIKAGVHRGNLLLHQRKSVPLGEIPYEWWLYSAAGKPLALLAPGSADGTELLRKLEAKRK